VASEETVIDLARILNRGLTDRSMARACRITIPIMTPMDTLRNMPDDHSRRVPSRDLRSSTCCTVHSRHLLELRMKTVENGRKTAKLFSTFIFEIRKQKRKW
jgi:hypothetical protein